MDFEKELRALGAAMNAQAADLAAARMLMACLVQQAPNLEKLARDFEEQTEDTTVRAMFSSMPEPFFQQLQQSSAAWQEAIRAVREGEPPATS